jgi:hypothetical protein
MATTVDWTGVLYPGPTNYKFWNAGDATAYTVHTPPKWCNIAYLANRGTLAIWVSINGTLPPASGVATNRATTDHCYKIIAPGDELPIAVSFKDGAEARAQFSTFGEDGVLNAGVHAMAFRFESQYSSNA